MAITVAEFSLSMLRTLPMHLGAQFIKEMITLFIDVSSRFVFLSLTLVLFFSLSNTLQFLLQGTIDAEPLGCHGEGAANVPADCRATW